MKKLVAIIMSFLMLFNLVGCSKEIKNEKKSKDKIKILVAIAGEDSEEEYRYFYREHLKTAVYNFSRQKNVDVDVQKMYEPTVYDLNKKLATKLYTSCDYDIIIFDNNQARQNFEREDVIQDITGMEECGNVYNSIKNKYFVPIAYEFRNDYYPVDKLEKLDIDLNDRSKYTADDLLRLMARNQKVVPARDEMIREAKILNLEYELNDKGLKIDLKSVKEFRDELKEVLLKHYKLELGQRKNYVAEEFRNKTNHWGNMFARYSDIMFMRNRNIFNAYRAQLMIEGREDVLGKKEDLYFLKPKVGSFNFNAFMGGVLKKSENKELALEFINEQIKSEKEKIFSEEKKDLKNYGYWNYFSLKNRKNLKYIEKKEENKVKKEMIDLRNKSIKFLDGELGEWIKYEIVTDEYIKEHVMYAIRPYILDDYKEEEVKKRIEAFEKQVNVILAEKQ